MLDLNNELIIKHQEEKEIFLDCSYKNEIIIEQISTGFRAAYELVEKIYIINSNKGATMDTEIDDMCQIFLSTFFNRTP